MLQGGTSLEVFKAWAPDPKNLVLLPSYQVGKHCCSKALLFCMLHVEFIRQAGGNACI
jgi:Cft2 family RNA processing exonuclease